MADEALAPVDQASPRLGTLPAPGEVVGGGASIALGPVALLSSWGHPEKAQDLRRSGGGRRGGSCRQGFLLPGPPWGILHCPVLLPGTDASP